MTGFLIFVVVCLVAGSALLGMSLRRGRSAWKRVAIGLVGLLVAAAPVLLVAAFLFSQPTPLEHDETLGAGIRVDDGRAEIWIGPGCDEVTELRVVLSIDQSPKSEVLELESDGPGVSVERFGLTPDAYPEGMTSTAELSEQALDLSPYRAFTVVEDRNAGASLPPAIAESARRPGQFWFGDPHGWLTPEEATRAVEDGRMSTICMPAPEGTYGSVD